MKKLILLISACALCVPCFGQDAPAYPCAPVENVVEPCAPAEQIVEQATVDCGCEGAIETATTTTSTVVVKQRVRRVGFRNVGFGKHECKLLQQLRARRASKRVRQNTAAPCAPAQVVQPCEPVGCAECL